MSYHFLCKRGIRPARTEQFLVFNYRYCDVSKIQRAERHKEAKHGGVEGDTELSQCTVPPPRKTRRVYDSPALQQRTQYVLPEACIICKKGRWITEKHTGKRVKEWLSNCEYESGK